MNTAPVTEAAAGSDEGPAATVDHLVSAILGKLGARSRIEAVAEAGRLGLT